MKTLWGYLLVAGKRAFNPSTRVRFSLALPLMLAGWGMGQNTTDPCAAQKPGDKWYSASGGNGEVTGDCTRGMTFSAYGHRVVHSSKMSIISLENEGRFAGAVQFPPNIKADQAIVRVFFWTAFNGRAHSLLRSREFVIPVIAGGAVMFDEVMAPRKDVRNIEVTLVHNLSKRTFDKFDGDTQ